jgi:NOL1/NOP2/sun family putative RNA methylase
MLSKQFFLNRYCELGWEFKPVSLKQSIRINTMNASEKEVTDRLIKRGVSLERISFLEHGYWIIKSEFSLGATSEYLLGLYSIQETAAQIPAIVFNDLEDETVLDACAAPGGKTIQMANIMHNTGAIVAVDISRDRLAALTNHLERCNANNVMVCCSDAREISRLGMKFNRILLDVPCSGNFAADRNWFHNRSMKDIEANAELQKEILKETAMLLEDGGEMVYSTCSLEPEEDELNVQWAISNLNLKPQRINCYGEDGLTCIFGRELDASISKCKRIWPSQSQGFFICKLKRG